MDNTNFTVNDSFKTISQMIDQAKQKYEQNGILILCWGILVSIAGITQYVMIQNGQENQSYYAWLFTMIPGFIATFILKAREGMQRTRENKSTNRMGFIWLMAGCCALITGFLVGQKFGIGFTAMIYIPFCMAGLATGLYLRDSLFIAMAILATLFSYATLFIPFQYHPLCASLFALVLMIIPGIKLFQDHKKRQRV